MPAPEAAALLPAEALEILQDVVPGFEGVAAEGDGGGHGIGRLGRLDEVVAIEQVALVGEHGVAPGGYVDVLLQPAGGLGVGLGHGRRCWGHEVHLVALNELAHGLLAAAGGMAIGILQGLQAYVDDGTLAALLAVIDPADDGQDAVHERAVVHAVLAVEADGLRIVLMEQAEGVDQIVLVAEEAEHAAAVLVVKTLEAPFGHLPVLLDQGLVDIEGLDAVLTGVLKLLRAGHAVGLHGVGDAEGGVGADAPVAAQLLGVHAAHRRAQDEVGLALGANLAQQGQRLFGVYGQVGGHDSGVGEGDAQATHRARLSAAAEAMDIEQRLTLQQLGELLYILVFHFSFVFSLNNGQAYDPWRQNMPKALCIR